MDPNTFTWITKYHPKTVSDCILPDRIKKIFQSWVDTKFIPNAFLYGTPGVGKTTIAIAVCEELGYDYIFLNASKDSGIDTLRNDMVRFASTMSLTGSRKCIILDEADYLNPNSTQPALRGVIDEFKETCSFILTGNIKNRIIEALHSRCPDIEFKLNASEKKDIAMQFMKRLEFILKEENVSYKPNVLAALITKFFPDMRRTINELQKYSIGNGSIDEGILAQVGDVNLKELVDAMKEKDFATVKKWVVNNNDSDPNRIYRQIYEALGSFLKPHSVPQIILILAKYQYQNAFVADGELNLLACIVEILVEGEFI